MEKEKVIYHLGLPKLQLIHPLFGQKHVAIYTDEIVVSGFWKEND